ncbi:MAG TPA: hypothetical protein VIR45_13470 [Kiloniellaceae bacterium]
MLASHWFKQPVKADSIKIGSVYKTANDGNIVEIAKVIDVGPDALGIPHVTYDVSVERARLAKYEERRTLGLQSFAERFREATAREKQDA